MNEFDYAKCRAFTGERFGGRIWTEFDPALVRGLRAANGRSCKSKKKKPDILSNLRRAAVRKRVGEQQRRYRWSREEVIAIHLRYQAAEPVLEIARDLGCAWSTVLRNFRRHGLPVSRNVEERKWE